MRTELADRLELEAELRAALGTGAFMIHLQPQLDAGGRLVGAEALLRWNRAGHGMTPPGLFIPIAEQAGLMPALGREAMALACEELARWVELLGPRQPGDGGQRQRRPALRARIRRGGHRPAGAHRRPRRMPQARAHRIAPAHRHRARDRGHDPPARDGHPLLDRRLRHRLFLARLPAAPAARRAQDRPRLRARPARQRQQPGDRAHHHGTRRHPRRSASSPRAWRPPPSTPACSTTAATPSRASCSPAPSRWRPSGRDSPACRAGCGRSGAPTSP